MMLIGERMEKICAKAPQDAKCIGRLAGLSNRPTKLIIDDPQKKTCGNCKWSKRGEGCIYCSYEPIGMEWLVVYPDSYACEDWEAK